MVFRPSEAVLVVRGWPHLHPGAEVREHQECHNLCSLCLIKFSEFLANVTKEDWEYFCSLLTFGFVLILPPVRSPKLCLGAKLDEDVCSTFHI